jgi:hypothetical protein
MKCLAIRKPHRTRRFEMIWARHLKLVTKIGIAALALVALATSGNAQDALTGKFTLPFETHWGTATLPAGDYTFALPVTGFPYTLYIQGKGGNAIIMAASADERVVAGHAQLNLVNIADVQNVQTFEAPELGLTLSYSTPSQKHMGHNLAHQKTMPQTAPGTQVSENKTSSIAVQIASR